MIEITPSFSFDDYELIFNYVRASGPGGQNVNGVCTKTPTFLQTTRLLCLNHLLRA
jgi:protein subunit release factor B